jgi:YVTN family beta-propeller protein
LKEKVSHSRRKAAGQPITLQRLVVQAALLIAVLGAAVIPQRAMADTALPAINVGTLPSAIAVNAATNKIYVANTNSNNVTVIDGATNMASTVSAGSSPQAIAVNAATNKIYVANYSSNNVTVIDVDRKEANPLSVMIVPFTGNTVAGTNTALSFYVSNQYSPTSLPVRTVYYQLDTLNSQWLEASSANGAWTGVLASLSPGEHVLYAYAADGQDASSSPGASPIIGGLAAYSFIVRPANVDLSALALNAGTLSPAFSPNVMAYTVELPADAANVDVTATTADAVATMKVNGLSTTSGTPRTFSLQPGTNTVTTAVYAQDGINEKTYTLTINRANANLSSLSVNTGTLSPAFAPNTIAYAVTAPGNVSQIGVTAVLSDPAATLTIDGQLVAGSSVTQSVYLQQGGNQVPIVVTSANGLSQKTYILAVNGTIADANLSGLAVSAGTLSPGFLSGVTAYSVDVGNAVTALDVTATPSDNQALVIVNGSPASAGTPLLVNNLREGANTVSITVVARNSATKTYTLTVNRAAPTGNSGNTDLSALALNTGTLSPAFSPNVTAYSVDVGNAVTALDVTATPSDNQALVIVNGSPASAGTPLRVNNLREGANTVPITVVARNGATKTYTITVNRAASLVVTPAPTGGWYVIETTPGTITVPAGESGTVSLSDQIVILIPKGVKDQTMRITIQKIDDPRNLITDGMDLVSSVFEVLKDVEGNFDQPVSITMLFDPSGTANKRLAIYYYDEETKKWVEIGGTVNGITITASVNHFTKFAVFAIEAKPALPAFTDTTGHWAESYIKQAAANNIVSGYPDSTFKPNNPITRAEFTVMMANALKLEGNGATFEFTDQARIGTWAWQAIARAVQSDIVNGYKDGSFRADAHITRAEMASMIARALRLPLGASVETGFADDDDIPQWAKGAVEAIRKQGIASGRSGNKFVPNDTATRAEAAVMLLKMLERKEDK